MRIIKIKNRDGRKLTARKQESGFVLMLMMMSSFLPLFVCLLL